MDTSNILTNPYFYLYTAGAVVMLGILTVISLKARISNTVLWLQVFLVGGLLDSISQVLLFFADTSVKYNAVVSLFALSNSLLGASFIFFGLNFIGKSSLAKSRLLLLAVLTPAVLLVCIGLQTDLTLVRDYSDVAWKPWGYYPTTIAPYEQLAGMWIGASLIITFGLLIRYYFKTKNTLQKRQTRLIIIGFAIPSLAGIIGQGVLPGAFGIQILPLTSVANIFMGSLVGYALLRYGTSALDPSDIANNIVYTMNNAAIGIDEEMRIMFANRYAHTFLGYAPGKLVGMSVKSIVPPHVWHEVQLSQHTAGKSDQRAGGDDTYENRTFESSVKHFSGQSLAVNIYTSPYYDRDRKWRGVVLVFADIQRIHKLLDESESLRRQLATEKKGIEYKVVQRTEQLEREKARLQASVNSLQQGFMIVDKNMDVTLINQAARDLLVRAGGSPTLHKITKNFEGSLDLKEQIKTVLQTNQPQHFSDISVDSRYLSIYISPVATEKESIGCVLLFDDITEQRILERSKDEFFSIASHELRTPLTSIKGNSSMILDFYKDKLDDVTLQEMVTDIHTSANRLIDIVNDFLDLSRLEQGKMVFTYNRVHIEKVIESVAYEMRVVLTEKNLYLKLDNKTLDSLPEVWVDTNRLKQVVYNLVGNAAKFTDHGGITISAALDDDHKSVKILVSDTGRGMTTESQQLLFHKFQQASSSLLTRDTTRGTGLGLYISKIIVESMGGAISLDSSVESVGTTFSFTVPLAIDDAVLDATKPAPVIDTATGLTKKADVG
jgi:PAS domain S-box-containing protein